MSSSSAPKPARTEEEHNQGYYAWLSEKGGDASEWTREKYNAAYESYMPWLEDKYLQYFTSDNKASYATKEQLEQTKVTNVEPVNKLQDGINSTVGGQLGQGGLGEGVGNMVSKEGVNRSERGGKDESGKVI